VVRAGDGAPLVTELSEVVELAAALGESEQAMCVDT